jgi:hypothetical protein
MLPSFFTPVELFWLWLLLAGWAALLFGGFAFGKPDAANCRRMPRWTRMASSAVLVVAGWSTYAFSLRTQDAPFVLAIALGMTLGFVGDLFMAEVLPAGKNRILPGMLAFGLGHVAYIVGMLWFGGHNGLTTPGPRWGAWLAWLLLGTVAWYLVVYRPAAQVSPMHWAALPYTLLLSSTAGLACGLALQMPGLFPIAAGAILFLTSDLILATRVFNGNDFNLIEDAIWLTYGPGQMLIVYGATRALALAGG